MYGTTNIKEKSLVNKKITLVMAADIAMLYCSNDWEHCKGFF
jgi:hypothetical protein